MAKKPFTLLKEHRDHLKTLADIPVICRRLIGGKDDIEPLVTAWVISRGFRIGKLSTKPLRHYDEKLADNWKRWYELNKIAANKMPPTQKFTEYIEKKYQGELQRSRDLET